MGLGPAGACGLRARKLGGKLSHRGGTVVSSPWAVTLSRPCQMLLPFVGGVHAHTDPALQQQPAEGIVSLGRLGPARGWSGSGFRCWLVRAEGAPTHGAGSYGKQPAAHRGGLGWTWQDKPRDCPRDSGGTELASRNSPLEHPGLAAQTPCVQACVRPLRQQQADARAQGRSPETLLAPCWAVW